MVALEKELTQDQISDLEKLGKIKKGLLPGKWAFLRKLMVAYVEGMQTGITLEREAQAKTTG